MLKKKRLSCFWEKKTFVPGWAGVRRTMLVMHSDARGRSPFRRAMQNHRPLGCHLRPSGSIVQRKSETCTVRRAYCTVHVPDAAAHRAKVYPSSNGHSGGFLPENDLLMRETMREVGARESFFPNGPKARKSFFFSVAVTLSTSSVISHTFYWEPLWCTLTRSRWA